MKSHTSHKDLAEYIEEGSLNIEISPSLINQLDLDVDLNQEEF